jgi:hypothetical protein
MRPIPFQSQRNSLILDMPGETHCVCRLVDEEPPPEPPVPVTWDAATKNTNVTLSNGDLTASTAYVDAYVGAKSTVSHNAGKWAFRLQYNYSGLPGDEQYSGIAGTGYDPAVENEAFLGAAEGLLYSTDGAVYADGSGEPLTTIGALSDGGWLYMWVNATTGKIWASTSSTPPGDPEAGTGETHTFTPGNAMAIVCAMYKATSPPSPTDPSHVIDGSFSSGTFAAWGVVT